MHIIVIGVSADWRFFVGDLADMNPFIAVDYAEPDRDPVVLADVAQLADRECQRTMDDILKLAVQLEESIYFETAAEIETYPGPVKPTRHRIIDNAESSGANTHKALAEYYRPSCRIMHKPKCDRPPEFPGGPFFQPVRRLFAIFKTGNTKLPKLE